MRLLTAFLIILALFAGPAAAERRVALVVGNGAYEQVTKLANPRADAEAMAAALGRLGFEVELGVDLDLAGMRRAVQAFSRRLEGADVALFFYAGHGMQVYGQNYLLPVDARLETESDLDFSALPARLILSQMERWPATKIVMLDACRNNPFETALKQSMGASRAARALSRGLAPIETAGGTLLAYATDPGDVAADGEGQHSPFTAALLKHVEAPAVEINTMLARVRAEVYASTARQQRPWTETSLIGEFYLAPKAAEPAPVQQAMLAPPPPPAPHLGMDPRTIELALWQAAQAGGTAADYAEYLRQYPDGIFAGLARNRVSALQAAEAARQDSGAPGDGGPGAAAAPGAPAVAPQGPAPMEQPAATEAAAGAAAGQALASGGDASGAGGPGEAAPGEADRANQPSGAGAEGGPAGAQVAAVAPAERAGSGPTHEAVRPEAAEAALGLGVGDRREVQARLRVAGHDPRGVDGVFGPGTRTALSAWQAAEGLTATGYLDPGALARLRDRTETEYVAWLERQAREAEARQAAAERARAAASDAPRPAALSRAPAATRPARDAPDVTTLAPLPDRDAPDMTTLAPAAERAAPAPQQAAPSAEARSPRERYEEECHFVFNGSTTLERRCKPVPTGASRLGRRW